MKYCPVCQKQASDFAIECPHCKARMDAKVQRVEVITETAPKITATAPKADYLSIIFLSLILFFLSEPISYFRNIYGSRFYGEAVMIANIMIQNCLPPTALAVFTALLVCVGMYFYHRQEESLGLFSRIALAVIMIFMLLCSLLTLVIPPEVFISDTTVIGMAEKTLTSAIFFNALLYPGYVLLSYWGIQTLGKIKGYIAAAIGAFLLLFIIVLTLPICLALKLTWSAMYFFAIPLLAHLLYAGVLAVFQLTGRKV